jgi:hypothetical protein
VDPVPVDSPDRPSPVREPRLNAGVCRSTTPEFSVTTPPGTARRSSGSTSACRRSRTRSGSSYRRTGAPRPTFWARSGRRLGGDRSGHWPSERHRTPGCGSSGQRAGPRHRASGWARNLIGLACGDGRRDQVRSGAGLPARVGEPLAPHHRFAEGSTTFDASRVGDLP